MTTVTFTEDEEWTVPDGIESIKVTAEGEAGEPGDGGSGDGGRVVGDLPVTEGETLLIRMNYGSASDGTVSGTAADVRRSDTLSGRLIVAAGGGSGGRGDNSVNGSGGDGGPNTGQSAESLDFVTTATGGTQTEGGTGGDGGDGSFGQGGSGSSALPRDAGSGGAGWYGGAGGEDNSSNSGYAGGGGGGSNYVDGFSNVIANQRGASSRGPGEGCLVEFEFLVTPDAPSDVTATEVDGEILIEWSNPDGEFTKVEIHRSDTAGVDTSSSPLVTLTEKETSYVDTSTLEAREYHYRLVAINDTQQSDDSEEVSATLPLPAPADVVVANVGSETADVSWELNSSDEDHVVVELSTNNGETWVEEAVLDPGTESYSVTNLPNGTAHRARVVVEVDDE